MPHHDACARSRSAAGAHAEEYAQLQAEFEELKDKYEQLHAEHEQLKDKCTSANDERGEAVQDVPRLNVTTAKTQRLRVATEVKPYGDKPCAFM